MSTEDYRQPDHREHPETRTDDTNPTPAPTPRTDEAFHQYNEDAKYHTFREKVRTLERELASAQAELAMATDAANKGDQARDIADAQAQQIIELKIALAAARDALQAIAKTKWVATTEEALLRGGNTPACAAEFMHAMAEAALDAARAQEGGAKL